MGLQANFVDFIHAMDTGYTLYSYGDPLIPLEHRTAGEHNIYLRVNH